MSVVYKPPSLCCSVTAVRMDTALSRYAKNVLACTCLVDRSFQSLQLFGVHQAPLSMGFSRQEYCSRLPFPPPRDLPEPGIESASLVFPELIGRLFTTVPPKQCLSERC